MQPISEIIKHIGLPIWICWIVGAFFLVMSSVAAVRNFSSGNGPLLAALPIPTAVIYFILVGFVFYSANDSIKREKELEQKKAFWAGESAAIRSAPLIQVEEEVRLDYRIKSLEGIIGYLEQSIKMGHEPEKLAPMMLILAKEMKNIRDGK